MAEKTTEKEFDVQRLTNGLGHKHMVVVLDEAIPDIHIGTVLIVPYAEGFKDPKKVKILCDDKGKPKSANGEFAVVSEYIYD